MSETLIGPDQHFALWAVLIGLAAFGFWCERFPWGRKYSGVMIMMTVGIILSNLRVIPTASPVYDIVWEYLVPLAIALLLLQANLRRILTESGPVLIAFLIGSATVVAGTIAGVSILDLGDAEAELAGVFSATYIGGSLNFAAVAEVTGFKDSSILAASVAADNIVTNLHFLFIIMLPGFAWLAKRYPSVRVESTEPLHSGVARDIHHIKDLGLPGLLTALAVAFMLTAIGNLIADSAGYPQYAILVITLLSIAVGTLFPGQVARMSGHYEAGNVLIFIFLASIAATADIWQLIGMAPVLFVFASIIIVVHLVILFVLGLVFRFELGELIMASAVCIGGSASAPAIASAKGWRDLLIPGILAGSLGNAIGSFIGVSIAGWLG
jgi:uncharacterized membrane protein